MLAAIRAEPTAPAPMVTAQRIVAVGVESGRPGCAACHMQDGAGQPQVGIPRLAGLTSSYIRNQLDYFAAGQRYSAAMTPYARQLGPAQREAVAGYFASLPIPLKPEPQNPPEALLARGRALFLDGDFRTGVLPCAECHGPTGLGVGDFSPRLAGQSAAYVGKELWGWHAGNLRDPKGAFMQVEAGHLSSSDIDAVADFVSSLGETVSKAP